MTMIVLPWRHAVQFLFSPQCSSAAQSTFARFSAVCCSGTCFTLQKFPFVHQSGSWWSRIRLFWVSPLNQCSDLILTGCRSRLLAIWQFLSFGTTYTCSCVKAAQIHVWSVVSSLLHVHLKNKNTLNNKIAILCWIADFFSSLWNLQHLSYGNDSLHVDAAFQQTLWSVAPICSGSEVGQGKPAH